MHGDHPFLSQWLSVGRTRVWGVYIQEETQPPLWRRGNSIGGKAWPGRAGQERILALLSMPCAVLLSSELQPSWDQALFPLGWTLSPPGLGCSPPQVGSVTHSAPYPGAQPLGPGSGGWLSEARALP